MWFLICLLPFSTVDQPLVCPCRAFIMLYKYFCSVMYYTGRAAPADPDQEQGAATDEEPGGHHPGPAYRDRTVLPGSPAGGSFYCDALYMCDLLLDFLYADTAQYGDQSVLCLQVFKPR